MPLIDLEKPIGYFKEDIIYTEKEIKAIYSNTSFPTPFVAPNGFTQVFYTPNPATDLQVGTQDGTEIDSKGNRVIKWAIRDKTVEELEADEKIRIENNNNNIKIKIAEIESEKQPRAIRESYSTDDIVREQAIRYIKQYIDEITALRGQLL